MSRLPYRLSNCLSIFAFFVSLPFQLKASPNFVYIAVSGEDRIAIYEQDEESGRLRHLSDVKTSESPKTLGLSPDSQYLFASLSGAGKIASFKLDPKSGHASLLSEATTGAHASFFEMDDLGRFLMSSYYSLGKVMVHKLENGVLDSTPLQVIATDERAHSLALDPSNRFLFVSHTAPNAIFQFQFNRDSGHLTANNEPRLQRGEGTGPRHLRFDSNGEYGYGSDEQGDSVTTYRLNPETGRLVNLQTLTTLPDDFNDTNATSDVRLDPSGRFVYVINRGHDSIAAYSIDKNSHLLSFIDRIPCETQTRSFDFSNDGRFLYAASSRSDALATYAVNPDSGRLRRIDTTNVGKGLWWIQSNRDERLRP